jgi:hypothetical protein
MNKWLVIWQPTPNRVNWTPRPRATIVEFGPDPANGPLGNENEIELAIEAAEGAGGAVSVSVLAMVQYDKITNYYQVVIADETPRITEIEL